ncbi:hypothetical protein BDQ17DRAFT_1348810 [Cyathus striatus]|nr:hypothetical protein BDQ17DRAFT_1348810 [Cyathus striatus]
MLAVFRPALRHSQTLPLSFIAKSYIPARSNSTSPDALGSLVASLTQTNELPPQPGPDGYPPSGTLNPRTGNNWKHILKPFEKPVYHLHCMATMNNSIVAFTKPDGSPMYTLSGGMCGFKGANRSSFEAGYQCAVRMFKLIENLNKSEKETQKKHAKKERRAEPEKQEGDERSKGSAFGIEVIFKGFGKGRDAFRTAILAGEGEYIRPLIVSVGDRTAIKIGGTRAKKARRS